MSDFVFQTGPTFLPPHPLAISHYIQDIEFPIIFNIL